VGRAAPPGGNDAGQIRELLTTARGYLVVARDGKRVGAFIELVGSDGEQIAVRHDGTFLWRRRLLPTTTVASVLPDRRAVVLNIDRRSIVGNEESLDAVAESPLPEGLASSEDVQGRIARYLAPGEPAPDALPGMETADSAQPHIIFISSSHGYMLVERDGPLPLVGEDVELPEQPGLFVVAKVGPSPLPNDSRICAYLEPKDVGSSSHPE
jgi:hypothetical protein